VTGGAVVRPLVADLHEVGELTPVLAAFLATLDTLRPDDERSHRFLA